MYHCCALVNPLRFVYLCKDWESQSGNSFHGFLPDYKVLLSSFVISGEVQRLCFCSCTSDTLAIAASFHLLQSP